MRNDTYTRMFRNKNTTEAQRRILASLLGKTVEECEIEFGTELVDDFLDKFSDNIVSVGLNNGYIDANFKLTEWTMEPGEYEIYNCPTIMNWIKISNIDFGQRVTSFSGMSWNTINPTYPEVDLHLPLELFEKEYQLILNSIMKRQTEYY